jgi:hypothetical protein
MITCNFVIVSVSNFKNTYYSKYLLSKLLLKFGGQRHHGYFGATTSKWVEGMAGSIIQERKSSLIQKHVHIPTTNYAWNKTAPALKPQKWVGGGEKIVGYNPPTLQES